MTQAPWGSAKGEARSSRGSPEAYARQAERMEARVRAAEEARDRLGVVTPGAPSEWLQGALLGREAASLFRLVLNRVVLLPAPYRGAPFDPDSRVVIEWVVDPYAPEEWIGDGRREAPWREDTERGR